MSGLRKIAALIIVLSAMIVFSGCIDFDKIDDLTAPEIKKALDAAAETGKSEEIVRVIDKDVEDGNYNVHYTVYAADLCMELGDYESAEALLYRLCMNVQHSEGINAYFKVLNRSGQLAEVRASFPSHDSITVGNKPLSAYTDGELSALMTDGRYTLYSDGYDAEKTALPYGVTTESTPADLCGAAGFSETQAQVILSYRYFTISLSDDAYNFTAKMSDYAAFSQHPSEDGVNRITIGDGKARLEFDFLYGELKTCVLYYNA